MSMAPKMDFVRREYRRWCRFALCSSLALRQPAAPKLKGVNVTVDEVYACYGWFSLPKGRLAVSRQVTLKRCKHPPDLEPTDKIILCCVQGWRAGVVLSCLGTIVMLGVATRRLNRIAE